MTFAAGLAVEGFKPIVAIYSTFLQRAYDQLIHDVALQNLPVVFALDRAGLVGSDGATHQGSYDLTFLRCIPNMTIMAPADENECRQMLYTATTLPGPSAVTLPARHRSWSAARGGDDRAARRPRAAAPRRPQRAGHPRLRHAARLRRRRSPSGSMPRVVNMRFVKPLDEDLVISVAARHRAIMTIEENATLGGAGSAVAELLASEGLQVPLLQIGIPDRFIEHGSRDSCLAAAGLDLAGLTASIERWWAMQAQERMRSAGGG